MCFGIDADGSGAGACATVQNVTGAENDGPSEYNARPLRAVIGEGVRRVREQHTVRQDEISRAARAYGLTWSRSKVALLERGEKPVSAEELALLPFILSAACRRPIHLPDLIEPDEWVQVGSRVMPGRDLVAIYAGKSTLGQRPTRITLGDILERQKDEAVYWDDRERLVRLGALDDTSEHYPLPVLAEIAADLSLAEQRAASRLGERPLVVGYLARMLWSRALDDERDRIVAERDPDASPDRRRALRGTVSRELVDALADEIARRDQAAATDTSPEEPPSGGA